MKATGPFLAVFVLAGLVAGCGHSTFEPETTAAAGPAVQAAVGTVEKQSLPDRYEAVGTVRAKVTATIQSKLMGHVLAVNVREGDRVEAGQVLVEIDPREVEAQVKRAEGGLRQAQEARRSVEDMVQASIHAATAADANNALAETTYNRFKVLQEKEAISRQLFDEADAKFKGASAEKARAAEMVQSAQANRGEVDAQIEQAKAELSTAQTMLSYATIKAPFAGIITGKSVDVGDLASPGAPLLVLEDPQQFRLEAQVSEEQVHSLAVGNKAVVRLDSLGDRALDGTVSEIVPAADPASRTSVVKIDLPQDSAVRSGMFGRALFEVGKRDVITIPQTAVIYKGQLVGVYFVGEGDVARLRLITVGKTHGAEVEVLSGLEPGDRIVLDKTAQVSDGAVVHSS